MITQDDDDDAEAKFDGTMEQIVTPETLKLPVDLGLKLLEGNLRTDIIKDLTRNETQPIQELESVPPFPRPYIFALLSSKAYEGFQSGESANDINQRLDLPDGWKVLTAACNTSTTNGYHGIAFWNIKTHHVVIAHRGTTPTNIGAEFSDIHGIIFNKFVPQMQSAATFANIITKAFFQVNQSHNVEFELFFTGHSLGGWLAQITTFTTKYLYLTEENVFHKAMASTGYHPHATVFDSPGAFEMLQQMKLQFDVRYCGNSTDLFALDITTYLAAPNRINTRNTHIGKLYRLFTDLADIGWFEKHTFAYNLVAHSMEKILKTFDPLSGEVSKDYSGKLRFQEVIDWPISGTLKRGEEYKNFFEWASTINNFHPDPADVVMKGSKAIRYQTKLACDKSCNMNVFTTEETKFLTTFLQIREMRELFTEDLYPVFDDRLVTFLNTYNLADGHLICSSRQNLEKIIPFVKRLLKLFPGLLQKVSDNMSLICIIQRVYENATNKFLAQHCQLKCIALPTVQAFVKNNTQTLLQIHCEDNNTTLEANRCFDSYVSCMHETLFNQTKHCTVLNASKFYALQKSFTFSKLTDHAHLFIISLDLPECSVEDVECIKSLVKTAHEERKCKVIIVHPIDDEKNWREIRSILEEKPQYLTDSTVGRLTWEDLTAETQKMILSKNLKIQNKHITLARFLGENATDIKIKDFLGYGLTASESELLVELSDVSEDKDVFEDDSKHGCNSNIHAMYFSPSLCISSKQFVNMLLHDDSSYFLLSNCTIDDRLNLIDRLWRDCKLEEGSLSKDDLAQCIKTRCKNTALDNKYALREFKTISGHYPEQSIHWLTLTPSTIVWNMSYDNKFYETRALRKVIVNSTLRKRLLSQTSNKVYIIAGFGSIVEFASYIGLNTEDFSRIRPIVVTMEQLDEAAEEFQRSITAAPFKQIHLLEACISEKGKNLLLLQKYDGNNKINDSGFEMSNEFQETCKDGLVVLIDDAGAGKSTSLARLYSSRFLTCWTLQIHTNRCHTSFASSLEEDTIDIKNLVRFCFSENATTLGKTLLQYRLTNRNQSHPLPLLVIVDGFDEIPQDSRAKLTAQLTYLQENVGNIQIVVSSRPHLRPEEYFQTLYTYELSPFCCDQQTKFLEKLLSYVASRTFKKQHVQSRAISYASKLVREFHPNQGEPISHFMGYPLNLCLVAELFNSHFMSTFSTPLPEINFAGIMTKGVYDRFVTRKLNLYFEQQPTEHLKFATHVEWIRQTLVSLHRSYALLTCFPDHRITKCATFANPHELQQMFTVGLLTVANNGTGPLFIHSTFAEYFLVDLVSEAGLKNNAMGFDEILVEILSNIKWSTSRMFLDEFLASNAKFEKNNFQSLVAKGLIQKLESNKDEELYTALYICAYENRTQLFKYIIECFMYEDDLLLQYIGARNSNNETILYTTVKNNQMILLTALLKSMKNLSGNIKEDLILSTALRSEFDDIDHCLVSFFASVLLLNNEMNCTLVEVASLWQVAKTFLALVRAGDLQKVQETIANFTKSNNKKYLLNVTSQKSQNAIHIAAAYGFTNVVSWLILQGLHVNVWDRNREGRKNSTPLHLAAENGHLSSVQVLVNAGGDIESKDRNGRSVLYRAVRCGHLDVVKYLVSTSGANINVKDKSGMSMASWAARNGHDKILLYLIEHGARLDDIDKHGMTALHHAAKMGHSKTICHLAAYSDEEQINVCDTRGFTPLHYVVKQGMLKTVQMLIQHSADIQMLDQKAQTIIFKSLFAHRPHTSEFYAVVRTNNLFLFNLYLKTYFSDYKPNVQTSDELRRNLNSAVNKVNAFNLQLSESMTYRIRELLISSRFLCHSTERNVPISCKLSYENVLERLKIILEEIRNLLRDYRGNVPVDSTLLLELKYIAKNIRILKRVLKPSYIQIPWEEMEFCLCLFILANERLAPEHFTYCVFLAKPRLMHHLREVAMEVASYTENIQLNDIYGKLPQTGVGLLALRNKKFQALYDDHDQVRTIYSLLRIDKYINYAVNLDAEDDPKITRLFLERALQIIGECLKYSAESPNMPSTVLNLLQRHAPSGLIETAKSVRDSLSHSFSMKKRLAANHQFQSRKMQNDLKKIGTEIRCILLTKKVEAFKVLCELIGRTKTIDECLMLIKPLDKTLIEDVYTEEMITQELAVLSRCITSYRDILVLHNVDEIEWQEELDEATSIIQKGELRTTMIKLEYNMKCERITKILKQIENGDIESAQKLARTYLILMNSRLTDREDHVRVVSLLVEVYQNIERVRNDKVLLRKLKLIIEENGLTVDFNTNNIKIIEDFKNQLTEKDLIVVDSVKSEIDEVLEDISELMLQEGHLKEVNKLTTIMKTQNTEYNSCKQLTKLLNDLNEGTISKNEFAENEFDWLVSRLTSHLTKKKIILLKSTWKDGDYSKCRKIIETSRDKYGTLLNSVKNMVDTGQLKNIYHSFEEYFNQIKVKISGNVLKGVLIPKYLSEDYYNLKLKDLEYIMTDSVWVNMEKQPAMEILLLDLLEILESEKRLMDNVYYLENEAPALLGKQLRNYLAHGDVLADVCLTTYLDVYLNALEFVKHGTEKTILVGEVISQNEDTGRETYAKQVEASRQVNRMLSLVISKSRSQLNTLLKNGVDIKSRNVQGETALHHALLNKDTDMQQFLIEEGLSYQFTTDTDTETKLSAIDQRDFCVLMMVIQLYAFEPDEKTMNRLSFSEYLNNIVEWVVSLYGDVDRCCPQTKWTLLHMAVSKERLQITEYLLKNNATVNILTSEKQTPLHLSAMTGNVQIASLLLSYGADVNAEDDNKETAIFLASQEGHYEMVETLLANGADIFLSNKSFGFTPFHLAVQYGHLSIVETLIANGSDVNYNTFQSCAPLHLAARSGHYDVTCLLLQHEADCNATDVRKDTPLHVAAQSGVEDVVASLIRSGSNANALNVYETTPLHLAALGGHHNIVDLLIEGGAFTNIRDTNGVTELHIAAEQGFVRICQTLLRAGSYIDCFKEGSCSPLHRAAAKGHEKIVELILMQGNFNCNIGDDNGRACLFYAADSGHVSIVNMLITNGAKVDYKDKSGETPLHYALKARHKAIAEILLSNGANPNFATKDSATPLQITTFRGYDSLTELLLVYKAKPNLYPINPELTPLNLAVLGKHVKMVFNLIKYGANVNKIGEENHCVLHTAACVGSAEITEILLQNDANPEILDPQGRTALHFAAERGHIDVLVMLLSLKPKIDLKEGEGWTPLHVAIWGGHIDALKLLIENGANVNIPGGEQDRSCLHLSVMMDRPKFVDVILLAGGNVHAKTKNNGLSPLHFACVKGLTEIGITLLKNGANPNSLDNQNWTPCHEAARNGHTNLLTELIKKGGDVDAYTRSHHTPLMLAVKKEHIAVVELLLTNGANVQTTDKNGRTPLHFTAHVGNYEIAELLLKYGANIRSKTITDWTPVHFAANQGHTKLLSLFANHGASFNDVTKKFATPLLLAIENRSECAVEMLLKAGADPNFSMPNVKSPMHSAILDKQMDVVKLLIDYGCRTSLADVKTFQYMGWLGTYVREKSDTQ